MPQKEEERRLERPISENFKEECGEMGKGSDGGEKVLAHGERTAIPEEVGKKSEQKGPHSTATTSRSRENYVAKRQNLLKNI